MLFCGRPVYLCTSRFNLWLWLGRKGLGCHSSHPSKAVQLRGGGVTGHMPHSLLSHCRPTGVMLRPMLIWGVTIQDARRDDLGGWVVGEPKEAINYGPMLKILKCTKLYIYLDSIVVIVTKISHKPQLCV